MQSQRSTTGTTPTTFCCRTSTLSARPRRRSLASLGVCRRNSFSSSSSSSTTFNTFPQRNSLQSGFLEFLKLQKIQSGNFSLLLKSKKNLECCVLAVQSLISILKSDNIFKDVFREVGELSFRNFWISLLDFHPQVGHKFNEEVFREFYCREISFFLTFDHKEFLPRILLATSAPLSKYALV